MRDRIGNLPGMIGRHPLMLDLYNRVRRVAPQDTAVLLVGETGTGKELVARALHQLSPRGRRSLIALNCAAIPDSLAEAELFGVVAGAYTGAKHGRTGALARAHQGTLLLDEIDSASLGMQAKLLRAAELREFNRVGSGQVEWSDFRLVAATSRQPQEMVASGVLRADLFYRLGCVLHLPALRDRPEDIVPLAEHFLRMFDGSPLGAKQLAPAAMRVLQDHTWPGNVRELRRTIEALVTFGEGPGISSDEVERELLSLPSSFGLDERARLLAVLEAHGWNAAATARFLGLGRTKLYELLRRHEIRRPVGVPA